MVPLQLLPRSAPFHAVFASLNPAFEVFALQIQNCAGHQTARHVRGVERPDHMQLAVATADGIGDIYPLEVLHSLLGHRFQTHSLCVCPTEDLFVRRSNAELRVCGPKNFLLPKHVRSSVRPPGYQQPTRRRVGVIGSLRRLIKSEAARAEPERARRGRITLR